MVQMDRTYGAIAIAPMVQFLSSQTPVKPDCR